MRVYRAIAVCMALCLLQVKAKTEKRSKSSCGWKKSPNIIHILADDLGYNDISYNDPSVKTPNLQELAEQGRILTQYYAAPACTPSRSSLLTGYFPHRTGLQHLVLGDQNRNFLPLNLTTLPERMKEAGYTTHMLGKWHIGFCKWDCTPNYRGFDTFYGFYAGMGDYYQHTDGAGYDWRDNDVVDKSVVGKHSTDVIEQRAIQLIENNDQTKPMFMYLSFPNPHTPFQPAEEYRNMYPDVTDIHRQGYLGLVSQLDASVGKIVDALKAADIYKDTLIVFTSDNGGEMGGGNNSPLRGGKTSLFEGGSRVVAFVHGEKNLKKRGTTHDGIFHTVDWLPTYLSLAGVHIDSNDLMDGIDQSAMIVKGKDSAREEIVYTIDDEYPPLFGEAAIRVGDYKLIDGFAGRVDGYGELHTVYETDPNNSDPHSPSNAEIASLLGKIAEAQGKYQLYNLAVDPNETNDLADSMPDKVNELAQRLSAQRANYVPPPSGSDVNVDEADPSNYGGNWSPGWC